MQEHNLFSIRCRSYYHERINVVLDYIDKNYADKLSVEILAGIACFSPYHFHRIFHAMVGQTVNDYVRKIRLNKASYQLLYCPEKTIGDIALDCGFSTLSDFTRAFRAQYGMPPSVFARKTKRKADVTSKGRNQPLPSEAKTQINSEVLKTIHTETLPDLCVAYIRCVGLSDQLKNPDIEKAFSILFRWGTSGRYMGGETRTLGIMLDSPEIMPMEQCRYDVCITVPPDTSPEGSIGIKTVQTEGDYVTFSYVRSRPDAREVFFNMADYIYGCWLPDNGCLPDDKPFLEFHRQDLLTKEIWTDFYVPIKPFTF